MDDKNVQKVFPLFGCNIFPYLRGTRREDKFGYVVKQLKNLSQSVETATIEVFPTNIYIIGIAVPSPDPINNILTRAPFIIIMVSNK